MKETKQGALETSGKETGDRSNREVIAGAGDKKEEKELKEQTAMGTGKERTSGRRGKGAAEWDLLGLRKMNTKSKGICRIFKGSREKAKAGTKLKPAGLDKPKQLGLKHYLMKTKDSHRDKPQGNNQTTEEPIKPDMNIDYKGIRTQ